jgi:16S rRNA (uracil1498-N3)-methyltransferase
VSSAGSIVQALAEEKAMRRFFVERIEREQGACIVRGSEARHIATVLRMRPGDRLILMDRSGSRFEARITSSGSREVHVVLERPLPSPHSSQVEISLCQALLKSQAMDYVIQKSSEIGVKQILPFTCERTVVKADGHRAAVKLQHWNEVALHAATQSDRDIPAQMGRICSFQETMALWAGQEAVKAILWEEEDSEDLKALVRRSLPAKRFVGVVGPEGGFSRHEIQVAGEAGFRSVSMGHRVLRAETAAIALAAIVQYEWGDLSLEAQGPRPHGIPSLVLAP